MVDVKQMHPVARWHAPLARRHDISHNLHQPTPNTNTANQLTNHTTTETLVETCPNIMSQTHCRCTLVLLMCHRKHSPPHSNLTNTLPPWIEITKPPGTWQTTAQKRMNAILPQVSHWKCYTKWKTCMKTHLDIMFIIMLLESAVPKLYAKYLVAWNSGLYLNDVKQVHPIAKWHAPLARRHDI